MAVLPTTDATAVSGCWYSGSHWWCNNSYGAPLYRWEGPDGTNKTLVGHMYSTTSWFIERSDCTSGLYANGESAPHPYRWIWTKADNGQWGWMSDKDISNETNPLPDAGPCEM